MLIKNVNSYVTVEEADEYLATKLDADDWSALTQEKKEQALITATGYVDSFAYLGYVVDDEQPLAFPRVGEYFDIKLGKVVSLGPDVPVRVQKAVIETALNMLDNPIDDGMSVTSLKIEGAIALTGIKQSPSLSHRAYSELKPFINNSGGMWWRAN
jgi:hypothetical protein